MILFLDFDGVLHPEIPGRREDFSCRQHFWQILRACPEVAVVFSTSWREVHAEEELIKFATHDGGEDLAHRFVGATPSLVREEGAYYPGRFFRREVECRLWLDGNKQQHRTWLRLDDFEPYFSPSCPTLHLVDPNMGLTDAVATDIIERRAEVLMDEFQLQVHFRLPLGSADFDHFIDAFLDMVESRGLMVGGMGGQLPLAETAGFVSALGGVPAEDDLQALVEGLLARHEVAHATISPRSETDAYVMGAVGK